MQGYVRNTLICCVASPSTILWDEDLPLPVELDKKGLLGRIEREAAEKGGRVASCVVGSSTFRTGK